MRTRNPPFALVTAKAPVCFPIAPSPALPSAEKADGLPGPGFNREEKVALEREEDGRPFGVLGEGKNGRASFLMGTERSVKIKRIFAGSRQAIADN